MCDLLSKSPPVLSTTNEQVKVPTTVPVSSLLDSVDHDASSQMMVIDGSILEGGGQVIRGAMSLSFLLEHKPLLLHSIRAGRVDRGGGGLKPQHLESVRLAALLSNRKLSNDFKGSTELLCEMNTIEEDEIPTQLSNNVITADTGTAGALTLILQAALPPLVFKNKPDLKIKLIGGTDVNFSPPIAHFQLVLIPLLKQMGVHIDLEIGKRGFCPKGGGEISVKAHLGKCHYSAHENIDKSNDVIDEGVTLSPIRLTERGEVCKIECVIALSPGFATQVSTSLFKAIMEELEKMFPNVENINVELDVFESTVNKGVPDGVAPVNINNVGGSGGGDGNRSVQPACQGGGGRTSKGKKQVQKKKQVGIVSVQVAFYTSTGCVLSCNTIRTHSKVDDDWIDSFIEKQIHRQLCSYVKTSEAMAEVDSSSSSSATHPACSEVCVDEHTADQLIVWMALAEGRSCIIAPSKEHQTSQHLETMIYFAEKLTGAHFDVVEEKDTLRIECDGIGLKIDPL